MKKNVLWWGDCWDEAGYWGSGALFLLTPMLMFEFFWHRLAIFMFF